MVCCCCHVHITFIYRNLFSEHAAVATSQRQQMLFKEAEANKMSYLSEKRENKRKHWLLQGLYHVLL